MRSGSKSPQLEKLIQRQIRSLVPGVVESVGLAAPVARILADKVPMLATLAIDAAVRRGTQVRFTDDVLSRALSAHARYMMDRAPGWQNLPPEAQRRVLLAVRPLCSEAPELFWPLCKLG